MNNKGIYHASKTKPSFFYGYIVVVAAFFTQIAMLGPRSSFGVFFKPMLIQLGWSRALTSGAYSISIIVQGLSGIAMGGLNDRLGPRLVMTLCGFLVGLGLLLMYEVNSAWQLYLFYSAILGIGMGGVYVPPMSTIAKWFVERRSVMTGIVIAGGGIGILVMPLLANWLISTYDWRNAFIILGAIVMVVVILFAQFLRRDPTQMGQVPYGENKVREQEINLSLEELSLKEMAHNTQFWVVIIILFCYGFGVGTIMVHIVPHATDLEIPTAIAAGIIATSGIAVIAGSIVMGAVADRMGVRQAFVICYILMSAAMLWLLIAREVWMLYIFIIVFGFSQGSNTTLHSPLVAELFGTRSLGLILGIFKFCVTIGSTIGPFIAGYIFDVNDSYQLAFIILAIASVIGVILAATLKPVKKNVINI